jgi:hypothetical protein
MKGKPAKLIKFKIFMFMQIVICGFLKVFSGSQAIKCKSVHGSMSYLGYLDRVTETIIAQFFHRS